jgi:anti-sigma-K factor RskA
MPETDLHELVAAYALNALDDDDRAAFEEHLAGCEQCAAELAGLRDTAAALAYVPETVAPPAALRSRILDTARAERPNVVPLHRRSARSWGLGAVAAVAVAAAVALTVWNVSLSRSLDRERSANQKVIAVLGEPGSTHALQGAAGRLAVAQSGNAALFLCGIGAAPSGKTYEAWVITGGKAARAGEFNGSHGCVGVRLARSVPAGSAVAVTIEPDGGSNQPTSTPIINSAPA